MGLFDRWFGRQTVSPPPTNAPNTVLPSVDIAVGAQDDAVTITFNDRNITFAGSLAEYDYDTILRDKQTNIVKLFELSDYFVDEDPIYRGIIKEVYTPFSIADDYKLVGANEKVKKKYLDYYKRISLNDKLASIFLQYYKYGNVYVYLMDDGTIITLPVHMVRIANVMVNGEPVVEFNCRTIRDDLKQRIGSVQKDFIEDVD